MWVICDCYTEKSTAEGVLHQFPGWGLERLTASTSFLLKKEKPLSTVLSHNNEEVRLLWGYHARGHMKILQMTNLNWVQTSHTKGARQGGEAIGSFTRILQARQSQREKHLGDLWVTFVNTSWNRWIVQLSHAHINDSQWHEI